MDLKQPIDLIKRSSWFDLLLLGLLLTPISLIAWVKILSFAGVSEHRPRWIVGLVLAHLIAIGLMMWGSNRYKEKYRTMTLVIGYLISKNFMMVSFKVFRKKYGEKYTDAYMRNIIGEFPQYLRIALLKDDLIGVARISRDAGVPDGNDAPSED
jgi:hypothetical protein